MARTTKLVEFRTGKHITVNNSEELIALLSKCNPIMMRHYQSQLRNTIIRGFGKEIKLERRLVNEV